MHNRARIAILVCLILFTGVVTAAPVKVLFSHLEVYKFTPEGSKAKISPDTWVGANERIVVNEYAKLELLVNHTTIKSQGPAEYVVQEVMDNLFSVFVSSGEYFISVPETEKCELLFTGGKILMENCQITLSVVKGNYLRVNVLTGRVVVKSGVDSLTLVEENGTCKYSFKDGRTEKGRFLVKYEYKRWLDFSSREKSVIKTDSGVVFLSDDVFTPHEEEVVKAQESRKIEYDFKSIKKTGAPVIRIIRPGRYDDIGRYVKIAGIVDDKDILFVEVHINGEFLKQVKTESGFFRETCLIKKPHDTNTLAIIAKNKHGIEGRAEKKFTADVKSPEITLFGLVEKNSYTQTIRGIIDDYTVKDVTIVINPGRDFEKRYIVPVNGLSFIKDIEIAEGENTISVYAEDKAGNMGRADLLMEYSRTEYNRFFGVGD